MFEIDLVARGDPSSIKRNGGIWPLITLIGVLVGASGIVTNASLLVDQRFPSIPRKKS